VAGTLPRLQFGFFGGNCGGCRIVLLPPHVQTQFGVPTPALCGVKIDCAYASPKESYGDQIGLMLPSASATPVENALFVEGGGSVIAPSGREPGAALALGTPDTIPSCGRRDRRAG
jgi:hypothetical protein